MKQVVKRVLLCAALFAAFGSLTSPLMSCDSLWDSTVPAEDSADTSTESGSEKNENTGGNSGGGSNKSYDGTITALTFAGNPDAKGKEVHSATFDVYDGSEEDSPGAGVIGHFVLGDESLVDTKKHQRPPKKKTSGTLTFKTESGESYTARWERHSVQDASAVVTKIVVGDEMPDEDDEGEEDGAVAITSFIFELNVYATGTQVQAAMFTVEDDTVVAHFSLGDGTETDTYETGVPEKTKERGTLEFEADNGVTYKAQWQRDNTQTAEAEVTKITGGEADGSVRDDDDDNNGGSGDGTITALTFAGNENAVGKEVKSATFDVYDGSEEGGPGAGVIGHFVLGDGTETDTADKEPDKTNRPRKDWLSWDDLVFYGKNGIVYEAKAERDSFSDATARVTEIKALGAKITSFAPYTAPGSVSGIDVKSATFFIANHIGDDKKPDGKRQVQGTFTLEDSKTGIRTETGTFLPETATNETSGTFELIADGVWYEIAWTRPDVWTPEATVNAITPKFAIVKTLTFAGNPDATSNQVKAATFKLTGTSTNSYILNASFTLGNGEKVHRMLYTSALLEMTGTNGVLAFEGERPAVTYRAVWERKDANPLAREATVTSILGGSPARPITSFQKSTGHTDFINTKVTKVVLTIADGMVTAEFTLDGNLTIKSDKSVSLPDRTETRGTLAFEVNETKYMVTWERDNLWDEDPRITKVEQGVNGELIKSFAPYTNDNATGTEIRSVTFTVTDKNNKITAHVVLGNGTETETVAGAPLPEPYETSGTFTITLKGGVKYKVSWSKAERGATDAKVDGITGGTGAVTVTYRANHSSGAAGQIALKYVYLKDSPQKLLPCPFLNPNYDFVGWAESADATAAKYKAGAETAFTKDATLYAVWKQQTVSVTYKANRGSGEADISMIYPKGSTQKFLPCPFINKYHDFLGWAESAAAAEAKYTADDETSFTKDATLYAVWKQQTVTVSFNSNYEGNGAFQETRTRAFPKGSASELIPCPFENGSRTFVGWATESGAKAPDYADGASAKFTEDTTLYAVWADEMFTVTFHAAYDGAQREIETQRAPRALATPLRTGVFAREYFTFLGWATAEGGSVEYAPGASVALTEDLNLYAVWKRQTVTVTFKANYEGGAADYTQSVGKGSEAALDAVKFTRDDYTFVGWASESGTAEAAHADGAKVTLIGDATLYAVWQKDPVGFSALAAYSSSTGVKAVIFRTDGIVYLASRQSGAAGEVTADQGTYTLDGTAGTITVNSGTYTFTISGDNLTVDRGISELGNETSFTKDYEPICGFYIRDNNSGEKDTYYSLVITKYYVLQCKADGEMVKGYTYKPEGNSSHKLGGVSSGTITLNVTDVNNLSLVVARTASQTFLYHYTRED